MKKVFAVFIAMLVCCYIPAQTYMCHESESGTDIRIEKIGKQLNFYFDKKVPVHGIRGLPSGAGIRKVELNCGIFAGSALDFLKEFKNVKVLIMSRCTAGDLSVLESLPELEAFQSDAFDGTFPSDTILDLSKCINLIFFSIGGWHTEDYPIRITAITHVAPALRFLVIDNLPEFDPRCLISLSKENPDLKFCLDAKTAKILDGAVPLAEYHDFDAPDRKYGLHLREL